MSLKKPISISALLMLLFLLAVPSFAQQVKYFKTYAVNEYDYSIVPQTPLSQEQAVKTFCNRFTYDAQGRVVTIEGMGHGLNFRDSYEKVYRIDYQYTGNTIEKRYYGQSGEPMKDNENNVFGQRIKKQDNGHRTWFLDEKGEITENVKGVYYVNTQVERDPKRIIQSFYNIDNQLMKNRDGVYKLEKTYTSDQVGEIRYTDREGRLMLNNRNYAVEKISYGKDHQVSEQTFFDTQENPKASYPYKAVRYHMAGAKEEAYDANGRLIRVCQGFYRDSIAPVKVNYNLVVPLQTQDLLPNFLPALLGNMFYKREEGNDLVAIIDSLTPTYYQNWYERLDSLKQEGLIFRQGYSFVRYFSQDPNNNLLAQELCSTSSDSLKAKLREVFLVKDQDSEVRLTSYGDPATRLCYGLLKVPEVVFFRWDDILFCVNPYAERSGNGVDSRLKVRNKVNIDFAKIPLTSEIRHVFFEGVTIDNFAPRTFVSHANFYFNYCIVNGRGETDCINLIQPREVVKDELLYCNANRFTFMRSYFSKVYLELFSGNSEYPTRFYPSFDFRFNGCRIENMSLTSRKFEKSPVSFPIESRFDFSNSNIDTLNVSGYYTSLIFDKCKVKNFYAANVNCVEDKLKIINCSFESPINFPNLEMADTAHFEMLNTSYQGYIKFPWEQMKGKINISVAENHLKSYNSLYNMLIANYKTLSLIKDADDCYFYWKEFERENFWDLYWKDPNRHWYNPFHVARALGYLAFNNINYYSCGYGIKPLWIFPFTIFIVTFFAVLYFFMPTRISNLEDHFIFRDKIHKTLRRMKPEEIKALFKEDGFDLTLPKQDLVEEIIGSLEPEELMERLGLQTESKYNISFLWYCFYFSFSTFTTIGMGDWYPKGKTNKALVMLEGALGWLCLGLFITTYANILLR